MDIFLPRIATNLGTMEPHYNVKDRDSRNGRRFIEFI